MMPKSTETTLKTKPLRIIALHGFTTSKEFMDYQLTQWKQVFKKDMEFITVDGPFILSNDKEYIPNNTRPQKWHADRNIPLHSNFELGYYLHLLENPYDDMDFKTASSVFKNIIEVINNDPQGIDGILAFSQGGYASYCFFSCLERGILAPLLKTRKIPFFDILINPQPLTGTYVNKVPSLHFLGSLDEAFVASEVLLTKFRRPEYMIFPEAHKIPEATLGVKIKLREFLSKQNRNKYLKVIEQTLKPVKL